MSYTYFKIKIYNHEVRTFDIFQKKVSLPLKQLLCVLHITFTTRVRREKEARPKEVNVMYDTYLQQKFLYEDGRNPQIPLD